MAAFIEWRKRQPPLNPDLGKDYRAKDAGTGHENNLRGTMVPGYECGPGKDPGMFPRV